MTCVFSHLVTLSFAFVDCETHSQNLGNGRLPTHVYVADGCTFKRQRQARVAVVLCTGACVCAPALDDVSRIFGVNYASSVDTVSEDMRRVFYCQCI